MDRSGGRTELDRSGGGGRADGVGAGQGRELSNTAPPPGSSARLRSLRPARAGNKARRLRRRAEAGAPAGWVAGRLGGGEGGAPGAPPPAAQTAHPPGNAAEIRLIYNLGATCRGAGSGRALWVGKTTGAGPPVPLESAPTAGLLTELPHQYGAHSRL